MKNNAKTAMHSLVKFIACNLLGFLFGFVVAFINYVIIKYDPTSHNSILSGWIISACMSVCFIIPFYILYFLKNKEYKNLYLKQSYEGVGVKDIMRMHVRQFTKHELPIIFIISVLLSFIPILLLGKSGITFLFSSSTFFTGFMTEFFFTKDIFIYRLIGFVLWDVYIVLCYFACLRMAYAHWDKTRLRKTKK